MVEAFTAAGLVRTLVPRRWGGSELGLTTHMEIAIELGRAYGSMAWVGSFLIDHPFILAHFDEQAQHDVWGVSGPDALIATSFAPVGKVDASARGLVAAQRRLGLGQRCGHAELDHARRHGPRRRLAPEYRLFLVPAGDLTIVDTWYSAGLRGSGSDNVIG